MLSPETSQPVREASWSGLKLSLDDFNYQSREGYFVVNIGVLNYLANYLFWGRFEPLICG